MTILQDTTVNVAALQAEIAALKLKVAQTNRLSVKVQSEKRKDGTAATGAISVYGLNKQFPVTLYAGQWERLFAFIGDIKAAIAEGDKAGTVTRRA